MRDLSRPLRLLLAALIFGVSYVLVHLLWSQGLPAYGDFLASISEDVINGLEGTQTSYRVVVDEAAFKVRVRVPYGPQSRPKARNLESEGRPVQDVTYNICLWAALFAATAPFVNRSARLRFLLIGLGAMVLWHICDLTITAKNCRWIVMQSLHDDYGDATAHSSAWHWFWNWAYVFNIRIIDPFLPFLLWTIFCSRSLLAVSRTSGAQKSPRRDHVAT